MLSDLAEESLKTLSTAAEPASTPKASGTLEPDVDSAAKVACDFAHDATG